MALPAPISSADFGIRTHSVNDLEIALVKFLKQLFADSYRLDNPTLNLAQPGNVSFDYTERAQTLTLKVPPRIERGRIPRTVTGEIAVDRLPDHPSITVQVASARVQNDETLVTTRICVNAYDENPDSGGYQDVLNMIETCAIALTTFGQGAIDEAYPIVMPFDWKLIEADTFPHFIGEITAQWELPSGRPLPDIPESVIPGEQIDIRFGPVPVAAAAIDDDGDDEGPIVPSPPDDFLGVFRPSDVHPNEDYIDFAGLTDGDEVRFENSNPNTTLPEPIVEGWFYFVVNATARTFQVSTIHGGAVLPLATSGSGGNEIWRRGGS
jgi:hypothetical protein